MRTFGSLSLAWTLGSLAFGCGSKDKAGDKKADDPPATPSGPAPTETPKPTPPADPPPADEPPAMPTSKACELAGPYKTASVKLTVSGGQTGKVDFVELSNTQTGTQLDEGGVSFTVRSGSGNERLAFNLPCKTGTVKKGLGNAQLETGTWIVGECTFDVKALDKTRVEGTFDCPEQRNISDRKAAPVKLVGTFTFGM